MKQNKRLKIAAEKLRNKKTSQLKHNKIRHINNRGEEKKWNHWKSEYGYSVINENVIQEELNKFLKFFKKYYPKDNLAIQLKIEFEKGFVRSLSKVQLLLAFEAQKAMEAFSLIFKREILVESNQYIKELHGRVVFSFKPIKEIKETKLYKEEEKQREINTKGDYTKVWSFKNFKIPANMNLWTWPSISFSNDKKSAISTQLIKEGGKFQLFIILLDNFNKVTASLNDKILFNFTDHIIEQFNLSTFKRIVTELFEIKKEVTEIDKITNLPKKKIATVYSKELKDTCYYENGEVKYRGTDKKGGFMTKTKPKGYKCNTSFITMDIETRTDENGKMIPICLSVYDGKNKESFIFTKDEWFTDMSKAIKKYMIRKHYGKRVYFHNFSKFDGIFMLDVLSTLGKLEAITRDTNIIELKLKFNYSEKSKKYLGSLIFRDSLLILPGKLKKWSDTFNIENKKDLFPFKVLSHNYFSWDLKFYSAPPRSYFTDYEGFSNITDKEYQEYSSRFDKNNPWVFKNELLKYCELDVVALHQVLTNYANLLWDKFEVNITDHGTLPSIAFHLFRMKHLQDFMIPLIYKDIHNDIKTSYYGGLSEVYKSEGRMVHSYDVNSLYPFAMKTNLMPVGLPTKFTGDPYICHKDPFGFFYVKVTAPSDMKIPFLPIRKKVDGVFKTICPTGTWTGMYFSEEIKNAQKYGYKFEILSGYLFDKGRVFDSYVTELYNMKSNHSSSNPLYTVAKLLLNSLYGRFGMNPIFEKCVICTEKEGDKIILEKEGCSVTKLLSGNLFIQYIESADEDINPDEGGFLNISVPIASAITAYSRIHMSYFLNKYSENILAIDTDGIKIDKHLDKFEIDNKELGKMKYEYTFEEACFPAPKMYAGKLTEEIKGEKYLMKLKGFKSKVPYPAFIQTLYKNSNVIKIHELWKTNFGESYIMIKAQPYKLDHSDSKREIIYDSCERFVNSIPLFMVNGEIISRNPPLLFYLNSPIYWETITIKWGNEKMYLPYCKSISFYL